MAKHGGTALRVALVADGADQRVTLRKLLEERGLDVVVEQPLTGLEVGQVDGIAADVILIDLFDEPDVTGLNNLIEVAPVPVLFSESEAATGRRWADKLVHKLHVLTEHARALDALPAEPAIAAPRTPLKVVGEDGPGGSQQIFVLGASIGGPEALRQFLAEIPENFPGSFLVAQHIGAGFDGRLAAQLDRATELQVRLAGDGDELAPGQVLVVPTEGRMLLDDDDLVRISGSQWSGAYSPTINDVIVTVAKRFGADAGLLLFSGMGDDGADGAVEMAEADGFVWAQDEASCVISSIPDAARRRGVVGFSGSPKELAHHLIECIEEREQLAGPG